MHIDTMALSPSY